MSTSTGELDIQMAFTRESRSRITPRKLELMRPSSWTVSHVSQEDTRLEAVPSWPYTVEEVPQNQTSSHYLYAFVILAFPVSFMLLCLSMRQFKFNL